MAIGVRPGAKSGANSDIKELSGLTTALSIAQGGTGAKTAQAARSALGAVAPTIYQSDETLTGDTWIDGKPIYRKIVGFTNITLETDVVLDSTLKNTYIGSLVKSGGYVKTISFIFPVFFMPQSTSFGAFYKILSTGMTLWIGSSIGSTHNGHIILEYTKA